MRAYFVVMTALLVIGLLAAMPASGQNIGVTVNGQSVQFAGTRPMSVQGRVLVPLRGVLEQMGAVVLWVPETRTVTAERGDRRIELPVGSFTGTVNGQPVSLDVPASIIGGSTMVPLRFLGEALGADVRWVAASRTVAITTGAAGGEALRITSFRHNATGWLRAGSVLEVTMEGTSGGTASFEIPGVTDPVPMRESGVGRYTAAWAVPPSAALTVSGASVIGALRAAGQERLIQAGSPVSIDTVPPKVRDRLPDNGATVAQRQPSISAVLDDGAGSGIDVDTVDLSVNNEDVTNRATVTGSFVSYRPNSPLPVGQNAVSLSLSDRAGNTIGEKWSFTVRAAEDVIKSFTHSGLTDLQPGDVITVRMEAEAGGTGSAAFVRDDRSLRTIQLAEVSEGVYTGEYTVRRGEDLTGAALVGTIQTKSGAKYTTQAPGQIGAVEGDLTAPVITAPKAGAAAKSPVTITGTAPPGTQVRLRLEYTTTVLGALTLNGVVMEQMVEVGNDGKFTTEPVNLGTGLVRGKDTQYTLTATAVTSAGQQSEPTVVAFPGQ